jgi:outer membrane murein-binding lipoprotein Lpp
MWKFVLAAALVSVVSGCVTSDGPTAQRSSAVRSAGVQQTTQNADRAARPHQSAQAPMIIGAAY